MERVNETKYNSLPSTLAEIPQDSESQHNADNKPTELPEPRELVPSYREFLGVAILLLDILSAAVTLLFITFGILIYQADGKSAAPGTKGSYLIAVSKYGPTIFPVLFAAIVSRTMKSLATWRLQVGTTVGLVEQLQGSASISSAFLNQISLSAFNFLGVGIILLWAFSPLGGQAALRVIYTEIDNPVNTTTLEMMDTMSNYSYGNAEGLSEALNIVAAPLTAAMMSWMLLRTRTQDIWGNIRIPRIEQNQSSIHDGWIAFDETTNVSYSSLVGVPISGIPQTGNTSFTISTAYLDLSCPVFQQNRSMQTYTNYAVSEVPSALNDDNCSWFNATTSSFNIALSVPCSNASDPSSQAARTLAFETFSEDDSITHVECEVFTTYIDLNVTCSDSTCNANSIRHTLNPPTNPNLTVYDSDFLTASGSLYLLAEMFPYSKISGHLNPIVGYLYDPSTAMTSFADPAIYDVGVSLFEERLMQILNSELLIGISPSVIIGSSAIVQGPQVEYNSTIVPATTRAGAVTIIRCSIPWLAVLVVASLICFLCVVVGLVIRFHTLVPDVLGTLALAMLDNDCHTLASGDTTLEGSMKTKKLKNMSIQLGDVEPWNDIGRIALVAPVRENAVAEVRKRRLYA